MQVSLHTALQQKQVLAPQLRQALKLLQLPAIELQAEVSQALEENIFLEAEEPAPDEGVAETETDVEIDDPSVNESWGDLEPTLSQPPSSASEDTTLIIEQMAIEAATLGSFLRNLLGGLHLSDEETICAYAIIDNINEEGYLINPIEDLAKSLELDVEMTINVLGRLKQATPAGLIAHSIQDRLLQQINSLSNVDQHLSELAGEIIQHHLDILANRDMKLLQKRTRADLDAIRDAVQLIRSLDPHPALKLVEPAIESIIPDLTIHHKDDKWVLELNERIIPRLHINSLYVQQVELVDATQKKALRNQLNEARQFIDSIQNRFETMARVATLIFEYQQSFLDAGEDHLRPLGLAQIANQMDVHESTVSRAISGKYVQTPHGVYPLNFFISHQAALQSSGDSPVETTQESLSDAALRAKIRDIIDQEPADQPYNDDLIARKLLESGIKIARRTVTKYRKILNIPSSRERKRENLFT